jgi:hypothetical protein
VCVCVCVCVCKRCCRRRRHATRGRCAPRGSRHVCWPRRDCTIYRYVRRLQRRYTPNPALVAPQDGDSGGGSGAAAAVRGSSQWRQQSLQVRADDVAQLRMPLIPAAPWNACAAPMQVQASRAQTRTHTHTHTHTRTHTRTHTHTHICLCVRRCPWCFSACCARARLIVTGLRPSWQRHLTT